MNEPTQNPNTFVLAGAGSEPQGYLQQDATNNEEAHYSRPGWSWGGFMFQIYFAACIKRYWYLAWLLAMVVPYIGGLITFGLMIYFGVKGRELAASSPVFKSKQQYIGFMKGVDHAGKVLFFVVVVGLGGLMIVGILASIVLAGLGSQRDAAREASAMSTARSLVPAMQVCVDGGGSIEMTSVPVAGRAICSNPALVDDVYPALVDGWEYGEVRQTSDSDLFYYVVASDNRAISCTMHGCDYTQGTRFLLENE